MFNTRMTRHYVRIDRSDRVLLLLPLFHVFGENVVMIGALPPPRRCSVGTALDYSEIRKGSVHG